eukprot:8705259-Pyramimonas_sp.AAC.1
MQSHGTSVGALLALLEGHQLLPSDPGYGGNVKKTSAGVYLLLHVDDNPTTHTRYTMAEETLND